MSQNVENKVVEFQFNNSNFEKNVSKSMSTLEKLKNALNFDSAVKGFDNLDRATRNFDMSSMEKSVGGMGDKFSALQTIAVGALIKIGEQAIVAGEKVAKALTIDQIAAGFDKYTNKVQSVATMYATGKYNMEEIEGSLSNLNTYTDKTSYSFSTLVDNMSKFTSAGVELQDAEKAMEGIGNWAALSGITAASGKVNQMAYNLSQAVGSGALLLQDWKSIENVNAATEEFKRTLIETGLEMGTLQQEGDRVVVTGTDVEVTVNNLRNTLQKRWVNDKVLLSVLGQYADETTELGQRAQKAAAEARTLEDAVGAVSDAISTSWMATHETLFGDYKQATLFFTGLQDYFLDIFESMNTARNELLSGALSNDTSWGQLQEMFETLSGGEKTFEEQMKDMAKRYGYSVDEMIDKYGSMKNAMEAGEITGMTVSSAFAEYAEEILKAAAATDVGTDSMTDYEKAVIRFANGGYGKGMDAMRAVTEEGWNYDQMVQDAARHVNDAKFGLDNYSEAQFNAIGFTKDQVRGLMTLSEQAKISGTDMNDLANAVSRKSGRTLLVDSLFNSLEALRKVLGTVKEAWQNIFPAFTSEKLYELIERFEKFTRKLTMNEETADKLRRTFEGLFAIVDTIGIFIKDVFVVGLDLLKSIFGDVDIDVLDLTGSLGDNMVAMRDWVKEHDPFLKALQMISGVAKEVIEWVKNMIDKLLEIPIVQQAIEWVEEKATAAKNAFIEWAESTEPIQNGLEWISQKAEGAFTAIKNGIQKILEIPEVANLISTVGESFSKVFGSIREFFTDKNSEEVEGYVTAIDGFNKLDLSGLKTKVVDVIASIAQALTDFWNGLKDLKKKAEPIFTLIGAWISEFIKNIEKMWQAIKSVFTDHLGSLIAVVITGTFAVGLYKISSAIYNISKVGAGLGKMLSGIGKAFAGYGFKMRMDGIANVVNSFGNLLKNLAIMMAAVAGLTVISDVEKLDQVVWIIEKLIIIIGIFMTLTSLFNALGNKGSKNVGNNTLSINVANGAINSMVQMAGSVLILAESLKLLAGVKEDDLEKAFKYLSYIIIEFSAVTFLLGKFGGKLNFGALSLVGLAGAVFVLSGAMQMLAEVPAEKLEKGLGVLTVIILQLSLLTASASGMKFGSGAGVLAMASSLIVVGLALKLFATMEWEDILKSLLVFEVVMIEFQRIIILMGVVNAITKGASSNVGLTILELSGSFLLLAAAMKIIGGMSVNDILAAGLVLTVFFGELIGVIAILNSMDSKETKGSAATVLALSASLILLAVAARILGELPLENLAKGVIAVDAIMAGIMGVVWASRGAGDAWKTITSIAAAMAVLAIAIAALSFIPTEALLTATAAIDLTLLSLAAVVKASEKADLKKLSWSFVAVGVILTVVAAIITQIGGLDPMSALASAASLSLLLLSISASMRIMGEAKDISGMALITATTLSTLMYLLAGVIIIMNGLDPVNSLASALSLGLLINAIASAALILGLAKDNISGSALLAAGALSVLLLLVAQSIAMLADMEPTRSLPAALALSVLLNAVAAATFILSLIHSDGSILMAVAAMALVEVALLGIAGILILLDKMDVAPNIETALALSILLGALAGVTAILAAVGPAAGMALTGALAMDGVIVAILALMLTIVALDEYLTKGNLKNIITAAIEVLDLLFSGLARIFANAIMTLVEGITSRLPEIGKQLSQFGATIQPFTQSIKSVDGEVVASVGNLATLIMLLAAAEVIKAIADWVSGGGNSIVSFGNSITKLVPFLQEFSSGMDGVKIDPNTIEAVKGLAELILILTATDILNGLTSWLTGGTSIEDFGESIVPLGKALNEYSAAILEGDGINSTAIKASAEAAEGLLTVADKMQAHGGVLQKLLGEKYTLDEFASTIVPFGEAMVAYNEVIAGATFDTEAMSAATTAADDLISLADKLQSHGGILQDFVGEKDTLDQFGDQAVDFAEDLVVVGEKAADVSPINIGRLKTAADKLVELANALPIDSGFIPWFKDGLKGSLSDFGSTLEPFAQGMVDFSTKVTGLDVNSIEVAATAAQKLTDLASSAGTDAGSIQGLDAMTVSFPSFGEAVSTFYSYIQGIWGSKLSSVISALQECVDFFNGVSTTTISNAESFGETLGKLGEGGIEAFIKGFEDSFTDVKTAAKDLLETYARSAEDNRSIIVNAFAGIIAEAIASLEGYLEQFGVKGSDFTAYVAAGAATNSDAVTSSITGPPSEALSTLSNMGPAYAAAANSNADAEVKAYTSKSSQVKSSITTPVKEANTENKQMTPAYAETASEISDSFSENLKGPGSEKINAEFVKPIKDVPPKINQETPKIVTALDLLGEDAQNAIKSLDTKEFLSKLETLDVDIAALAPDIEDAAEILNEALSRGMSSVNIGSFLDMLDPDLIRNKYDDYYSAGAYLASGLNNGIWDGQYDIYHTVEVLSLNALEKMRMTLDERSPSKATEQMGLFLDQGLANGVDKGTGDVLDSVWTMGNSAVERMRNALANATDENIDVNPVITPVLDLSEIQNGAGIMSGMLQNGQYQMMGSMKFASAASSSMGGKVDLTQQAIDRLQLAINRLSGQQGVTNNNTFNIESNDPEAVANAVSDILQHNVERTNAQWA